jgi:phosphoribosyl 1,2-cyclic phosphate phosphodiesterase
VMDGLHIQVDASPELRLQCLKENITHTDLFILTHGHTDHITGMDDLRRFCDINGGTALPVYSTKEALERVKAIFPYAILDKPLIKGYPAFSLHEMPALLSLPQGTIQTTRLPHNGIDTLGLIFTEKSSNKKIAYYTDCKTVPEEALRLAQGADCLVIDGLRSLPHPGHLTIDEAAQVALEIKASQSYLIHLTHLSDHKTTEASLPSGVKIAYDGLKLIV